MENVQTPTELAAAQEEKIRQLEQQLAESQKQNEKAAKEKAKLEKEKANLEAEKAELEETLEQSKTVPEVKAVEEKKQVKMVTIQLFKDNKEYKDDLTVLVNGVAYKIQRGTPVEVPDFVAEVIEHSATQDAKTAELIDKLVEETKKNESK